MYRVPLRPGSPVRHLMIDADAWILSQPKLLDMLQRHAVLDLTKTGQLAIARGYAFPKGIGRSVRALVLGVEYKSARRIAGAPNQFAKKMFALPQNSYLLHRSIARAR